MKILQNPEIKGLSWHNGEWSDVDPGTALGHAGASGKEQNHSDDDPHVQSFPGMVLDQGSARSQAVGCLPGQEQRHLIPIVSYIDTR